LDTIPNMTLSTAERIEISATAAAYKTADAIQQDIIERVQKIADKIDANQKRITSKDKWFANVMNYALAEFKKYFL
jgi:chorismate mutase